MHLSEETAMPTGFTNATPSLPRAANPQALAMTVPVAAAPRASTAILVALIVNTLQVARVLSG
jgi:hypothetical protein